MPFRWQGKYLFLTYPRSDFSLDESLHFFRSQAKQATFIRVSSERHEDGSPHRHVFIAFDKRFSFTNERRFDFRERHPNIQSRVDNPAACLDYVSKDGVFVDYGSVPDFNTSTSEPRESRNQLWGRLLDEATSASHFLQLVRENSPYDFATRVSSLFTIRTAPYAQNASSSSATLVPERPAGRGRSGTISTSRGSSTWTSLTPRPATSSSTTARSSGSRTTSPGSGAGGEFEATDKYRGKRTLVWQRKSCIVLCNRGLLWDWRASEEYRDDKDWFDHNVIICDLNKKLWRYDESY
ncbi:replication associated protein [Termite associated circular virus 3]|uniref:replication associated protein n=1 Tax=Termite associated circular virus 3 TaxID=2108551 RepID=UPI000DC616B2|nr:replication associated protein [Termite associated circular virus 3]AVK87313.2 replication associated protein [Termite associated circular virus 3]